MTYSGTVHRQFPDESPQTLFKHLHSKDHAKHISTPSSSGSSIDSLRFHSYRPEKYHTPSPRLHQPIYQPPVHPVGQYRITIYPLLGFIGILVEPLHKREVEACAGIEVLGRMEVEIRERREEEGILGDVGDGFAWEGSECCLGGAGRCRLDGRDIALVAYN